MRTSRQRQAYLHGVREAAGGNAPAFGFSIMITGTFGALASIDRRPDLLEVFLFAPGATLGFVAALVLARIGAREQDLQVERLDVVVLASALNVGSVLAGLATATLVALVTGRAAWLLAPFAAGAVYVLVSGLEFAVAEEAEDARD